MRGKALLNDSGSTHRCEFADRVLPAVVFRGQNALDTLLADEGIDHLRQLWDGVGKHARLMGAGSPIPSDSLKVREVRIDTRRTVVVTFQEPLKMPEAPFAAVLEASADDARRYLVLERAESVDDGPGGVLCEWLADGGRRNYGRRCPPENARR